MISGFDISNYQGLHSVADFQSAKAAGFLFVAIKCSEGVGYADPDFTNNWANAGAAGLARIAYHFCRPSNNSAASEVNWFLRCLGSAIGPGDNVAADVEAAAGEVGPWVASFLGALQAPTGVAKPFLYSGNWFIPGHLDYAPLVTYPLWDAIYNTGTVWPTPVAPWTTVSVWQHADNQAVPGFGNVDGDRYNGTIDSLKALGKGGTPTGDFMTLDDYRLVVKQWYVWPPMNRNPAQNEIDFWAGKLAGGENGEAVVDEFTGGAEFQQKLAASHAPGPVGPTGPQGPTGPPGSSTIDPNGAKAVKTLKDVAATINADLA